jgi:hypothetical protein
MAPVVTDTELQTAWRALAGKEANDGWQAIRIAPHLPCQVRAARQHPGDTEAILAGFPNTAVKADARLPDGHGFVLRRVDIGTSGQGLSWYSLTRHPAGDLQLFCILAEDLLHVLADCVNTNQAHDRFLKRLWAWLAFMKQSPQGKLSREAEIGLFGELIVLRNLMAEGIPPNLAVQAWTGPMESPQDFTTGTGGIEVKTQVLPGRPTITISSLEQLDTNLTSPLFLSLVMLEASDQGECLPQVVASIREHLSPLADSLRLFDDRLAHAGYVDRLGHHYDRSYTCTEIRVFPINDTFPRLARSNVRPEISAASYKLAMTSIGERSEPFESALITFQVKH